MGVMHLNVKGQIANVAPLAVPYSETFEAGSTCLNPLTKHFQGIDESQTTEEINQSEANLIDDL